MYILEVALRQQVIFGYFATLRASGDALHDTWPVFLSSSMPEPISPLFTLFNTPNTPPKRLKALGKADGRLKCLLRIFWNAQTVSSLAKQSAGSGIIHFDRKCCLFKKALAARRAILSNQSDSYNDQVHEGLSDESIFITIRGVWDIQL